MENEAWVQRERERERERKRERRKVTSSEKKGLHFWTHFYKPTNVILHNPPQCTAVLETFSGSKDEHFKFSVLEE
jgi:hypothetical protein